MDKFLLSIVRGVQMAEFVEKLTSVVKDPSSEPNWVSWWLDTI